MKIYAFASGEYLNEYVGDALDALGIESYCFATEKERDAKLRALIEETVTTTYEGEDDETVDAQAVADKIVADGIDCPEEPGHEGVRVYEWNGPNKSCKWFTYEQEIAPANHDIKLAKWPNLEEVLRLFAPNCAEPVYRDKPKRMDSELAIDYLTPNGNAAYCALHEFLTKVARLSNGGVGDHMNLTVSQVIANLNQIVCTGECFGDE